MKTIFSTLPLIWPVSIDCEFFKVLNQDPTDEFFLRNQRGVMPKLDEIARRYLQQTGFFQNFPLIVHEKQYLYDK